MKVKSPTASAANTATSTSTDGTVLAVPLTAAPVEAVTVYGRNALIRRVIRLESLGSTSAGTTLLRLRGVSGQLITDSLRVSAASPGLTILDVNARSFYATGRELDYLYNLALDGTSNDDGNDDDSDSDFDADEAVDPKTLPLRKQVAIAEKHVGKLKAQVDRMSEERSLFKAFMNKACHADASGGSLAGAVGSFTAGSGVSSERAISSIQDMLATYRSKAAQYDDEYEALRSKWSKAEKRLERLKERKRQQDELDRLAKQAFGPLPSGESSGGPQSRAGHVLHGTKAHDRVQMTEITIKVDAAEADQQQQAASASQSADIVVEYLVSSAGWKPVYDLRAVTHAKDDSETHIELAYFAEIRQNTHEPWNGAHIELSTAQPSLSSGASLPPTLPQPWKLEIQHKPVYTQPPGVYYHVQQQSYAPQSAPRPAMALAPPLTAAPPAPVSRARKTATDSLSNLIDLDGGSGSDDEHVAFGLDYDEPPRLEEPFEEVSLPEPAIISTFIVSAKTDIPADNSTHKVLITTLTLPAQFRHIVVPHKNKDVFLVAAVNNTTKYTILPGEAGVFLDGTFVGRTSLDTVQPAQPFMCPLGVDPLVRLTYPKRTLETITDGKGKKKNNVDSAEDDESLSGTMVTTARTRKRSVQQFSLQSAHRHSVNVVLHYNIPWTTDDRVAVGNVRVAQYSSDTGLRGPLQAVKFPFTLLAGDGSIKSPSDVSQASVTELHEPRKARDSKNAIRWVLPLDAGQTLKWSISFEVEHPTSQNLQGL